MSDYSESTVPQYAPPAQPASAPYAVLDPNLINIITRNSERLAALGSTVDKLNKDAEVTRHAMHEVNGKMQLFIIAEQACGKALESINETLKEHTEAIRSLVTTRAQWQGIWMAIAKVAIFAGALIGGAAWFVDHFLKVSLK